MVDAVRRLIDRPGGPIALWEWGGSGQPLLLVHPTGFHARVWDVTAEALTAAGFRVGAVDVRGHGDSAAPDPADFDYAWPKLVDDIDAALSVLSPSGAPVAAAGHSMGAALLALTEIERPGTFSSLWLFEPIVFPGPPAAEAQHDFPLAVGARRRRAAWPSIGAARDAYASKRPLDALDPRVLDAYVEHGLRAGSDGGFTLKCRPEVEAQHYAIAPMNGAWERLAALRPHTRVLCGGDSRDISPTLAGRIASLIAHATLEVWDGHGHFGPLADPERAAASIAASASSP
jgi:pimeloyl-ACP methyl ester carboxylesterase